MSRFKHYASRLLILFAAIQVLNLSMDAIEFDQLELHEYTLGDLNQFNSIVEFVEESVLGHTDAFPEYGNAHQKDFQLHKHFSFKAFSNSFELPAFASRQAAACFERPSNHGVTSFYFAEINPPPPKA